MAHDHRCYIICHDGIKAIIGEGLYDTGHPDDLSNVGLADIVFLIKVVCQPFQVAEEAKALPFWMSHALQLRNMDAAVQSLHLDDLCSVSARQYLLKYVYVLICVNF